MNRSKGMLGLVLSAGLLLAGCAGSSQEQETLSAVPVQAQTAGRGTLVLSNQFVGTVSPEESVYIIPMAQGKVTATYFEVGDEVKAGDILFQIDDSAAQLQLEQARLTYSNASQQADSALTTQQESTDLQLNTNLSNAQLNFEAMQIQWVNAKGSKEDAEGAVDQMQEMVDKRGELQAVLNDPEKGEDEKAVAQMTLAGIDEGLKAAMSEDDQKKYGADAGAYLDASLASLKKLRDQAQLAYASVNSQYEASQRTLEMLQQTADLTHGAVLEDTKEQLGTSLELAKLGVESAELALSYYQVTTPISGTVIGKSVEVNGMATASSPAYIIAGENTMVVTFQVSESIRNTLNKGQEIRVERNGAEFDGVITEVGNAVNAQTGLFQIKAAVHASGEELPSGVSVKITGDTYTAKDEIIIPYDAVYYETAGSYVYTVQDGRAVKTYVTAGIFDENSIQIVDGLAEGDVVITTWSPRLIDGVEVSAAIVEPESAQN
ncbi:MAG: efflux RND transporter periplasmic adaptor subunit [Clostridium sp.]|nr:efflux RND transporter periplasmic adaptor subunit [Acetatifactor muris]MCM1526101.1 efflux RND transporter periplasmic adaptor subunit [Bacteroides sp.]MCM1564162.1 efflux RND transporter periplasmic adaptor subunit [Clostridium sp.]